MNLFYVFEERKIFLPIEEVGGLCGGLTSGGSVGSNVVVDLR